MSADDDVSSFTIIPQLFDSYTTKFFNATQSELLKPAGMVIPKLPMYHLYHPFKKTVNDGILQVPVAMILPDTALVPKPLMDIISAINVDVPIVPFFLAQTLPYQDDTEVIPRYQYALF